MPSITKGGSTITGFFDWINERHFIFLKKEAGDPRPWTSDPILGEYKFTNVFRELDRGTLFLRTQPARVMEADVFNVFMYRLINRVETFEEVGFLSDMEDWPRIESALKRRWAEGRLVFTDAHMTVGRSGQSKIDTVIDTLHEVAGLIKEGLIEYLTAEGTLEHAFRVIKAQRLYGIGPFINYEIVSDLRWVSALWGTPTPTGPCQGPRMSAKGLGPTGGPVGARHPCPSPYGPTDVLGWANIGPGCKRGLLRLGLAPTLDSLRRLYALPVEEPVLDRHTAKHHVGWRNWNGVKELCPWPPFEMREIEHCLCEFDKYERVRLGEGRPRKNYP